MRKKIIAEAIVAGALTLIMAGLTVVTVIVYNNNNSNNMPMGMQGEMQPGGQQGGGGMGQNSNVSFSAAEEITEDKTITSGDYKSEKADENAIMVNGSVKASISGVTVTKTGDTASSENSSFYGNNSAILAKSGANITLKNIKVTTDANGGNGVFAYGGSTGMGNSGDGDGSEITISDSEITTNQDQSGGIMVAGGGKLNASNLTVNTAGRSSAAIRSDRGSGTMNVDGGTYTTSGPGSPAVYSTANITVKNATLTATTSEGAIVEGKNSITFEKVDLTSTNNQLNGNSTTYKNIFLYQSASGDADEGTSEFTAKDSKITTNQGDTIYVTNTKSVINLSYNTIKNNDKDGYFLRIQKDSWGQQGGNGGDVTLNMTNQTADGNIAVDEISTLAMNMTESSFTGTINGDNTAKSITLKLDKSSKLKLTGDTYITSLEDEDSTYSNIDFNGYKLYVNGKAIG